MDYVSKKELQGAQKRAQIIADKIISERTPEVQKIVDDRIKEMKAKKKLADEFKAKKIKDHKELKARMIELAALRRENARNKVKVRIEKQATKDKELSDMRKDIEILKNK